MAYDGLSSTLTSETLPSTGGVTQYTLDGSGTPFAVTNAAASQTQYLADDGQGNVASAVTTGSGALACGFRYDPWGTQLTAGLGITPACSSANTPSDLQYRSQPKDATTNNYQLGARTYDPSKAGFLSPDTFRTAPTSADQSVGTDPLTRDTYNYVNGDPLNFLDPEGHTARCAGSSDYDALCPGLTARGTEAEIRREAQRRNLDARYRHNEDLLSGALSGKRDSSGTLQPLPFGATYCVTTYGLGFVADEVQLQVCISVVPNESIANFTVNPSTGTVSGSVTGSAGGDRFSLPQYAFLVVNTWRVPQRQGKDIAPSGALQVGVQSTLFSGMTYDTNSGTSTGTYTISVVGNSVTITSSNPLGDTVVGANTLSMSAVITHGGDNPPPQGVPALDPRWVSLFSGVAASIAAAYYGGKFLGGRPPAYAYRIGMER